MGTDIHGKLRYKTWKGNIEEIELPPYFDGRDYDFFAIIGNVRNGYGFAGSKRYENPVTPITSNRGLPEDVEDTDFEYGDHSFSYLTLEDLQKTDLHLQEVTRTGWLTEDYYKSMKLTHTTKPTEWCGGASGKNIIHTTSEEYDINPPKLEENQRLYVQYQWKDTPFKDKIEKLKAWMELYLDFNTDPKDIVFVFGFDS